MKIQECKWDVLDYFYSANNPFYVFVVISLFE